MLLDQVGAPVGRLNLGVEFAVLAGEVVGAALDVGDLDGALELDLGAGVAAQFDGGGLGQVAVDGVAGREGVAAGKGVGQGAVPAEGGGDVRPVDALDEAGEVFGCALEFLDQVFRVFGGAVAFLDLGVAEEALLELFEALLGVGAEDEGFGEFHEGAPLHEFRSG